MFKKVLFSAIILMFNGNCGGPEIRGRYIEKEVIRKEIHGAVHSLPPEENKPGFLVIINCPRQSNAALELYQVNMNQPKKLIASFEGQIVIRNKNEEIFGVSESRESLTILVENSESSLSVAPFTYRANVTVDPRVVTISSSEHFTATYLNPNYPDINDVGILFTEKLGICP